MASYQSVVNINIIMKFLIGHKTFVPLGTLSHCRLLSLIYCMRLRARQHQESTWFWIIMMAKWYSGNHGCLKLPDISLTGEEKHRKYLIQETCPDRGSNPDPLRESRAYYRLLDSGEPETNNNSLFGPQDLQISTLWTYSSGII